MKTNVATNTQEALDVPMTESAVDIELLPSRLRYIADKTEPGIQRAGLRIAASVIDGLLAERGNQERQIMRLNYPKAESFHDRWLR